MSLDRLHQCTKWPLCASICAPESYATYESFCDSHARVLWQSFIQSRMFRNHLWKFQMISFFLVRDVYVHLGKCLGYQLKCPDENQEPLCIKFLSIQWRKHPYMCSFAYSLCWNEQGGWHMKKLHGYFRACTKIMDYQSRTKIMKMVPIF